MTTTTPNSDGVLESGKLDGYSSHSPNSPLIIATAQFEQLKRIADTQDTLTDALNSIADSLITIAGKL